MQGNKYNFQISLNQANYLSEFDHFPVKKEFVRETK